MTKHWIRNGVHGTRNGTLEIKKCIHGISNIVYLISDSLQRIRNVVYCPVAGIEFLGFQCRRLEKLEIRVINTDNFGRNIVTIITPPELEHTY